VPAIRPQAAGSPNYEPAAAEKAKIARRGVVAPLTLERLTIPTSLPSLRIGTRLLLVAGFSFSGERKSARGVRVRRNEMLMR